MAAENMPPRGEQCCILAKNMPNSEEKYCLPTEKMPPSREHQLPTRVGLVFPHYLWSQSFQLGFIFQSCKAITTQKLISANLSQKNRNLKVKSVPRELFLEKPVCCDPDQKCGNWP